MTTRADIAAALNSGALVKASEYRPSVLAAGIAWSQVAALDRDQAFAYTRTWAIYVVLPQEERAASIWFDNHAEELADQLQSVVYVDRIEPVLIPADNSSLFAIQITARSE